MRGNCVSWKITCFPYVMISSQASTDNPSSLPYQKKFQQQGHILRQGIYISSIHPSITSLITEKIITRHNRSQLRLLLKRFQVISYPWPNADLLPTRWCEFGWVKSLWLLVQEEYIAVRAAGWWWPGTRVVHDKWFVVRYEVCGAVGGGGLF